MRSFLQGALLASAPASLGGPARGVDPAAAVETSLFLIGDTGRPDPDGEPVLAALGRAIAGSPGEPFVVFLGDNVYPRGLAALGAPDRAKGEAALAAQVDVVRASGACGVMIPGNHDWDKSGEEGWDAVRRQGGYVVARGAGAMDYLPRDGCPGPEHIDLGTRLRLIVLDTQWWLHPRAKPGPGSSCRSATEDAVLADLEAMLATAGEREVVVVGHHPFAASGEHSGRFALSEHVFPLRKIKKWLWLPLPLLGSAYPTARRLGISDQDLSGSANRAMRELIEGVFGRYAPLAYSAGHEHGLEVHDGDSARHLLVSGGGYYGRASRLDAGAGARAVFSASGFLRIDVRQDGSASLSVLTVDARGEAELRYREEL